MSLKVVFMAQFQVFFKNKIKTITYLMHYVALHHWSKFQTNLTTFQWVTSKKNAQKQPKIVPSAENIWNFKTGELQIRHKWNLAQICTSWIPLIQQKWGCQWTGGWGEGANQKQKIIRQNFVILAFFIFFTLLL